VEDQLDDEQLAAGSMGFRQLPRMVRQRSSSQSWMMCDRVGVEPGGTA